MKSAFVVVLYYVITANSLFLVQQQQQRHHLRKPLRMSTSEEAFPLSGVIACVTGATRGIGKGIALGLAEQGATIYVTGRSLNSDSCTEQVLGGTLADLVVEIEALGGKCVPVQCDHREDVQVENLFKQISVEHGKLDILVNNAFQVPSLPDGAKDKDLLFRDFWEQPGWFWDSFMTVGLRSHYVASCYAVPMLKAAVADASKVNRKPMIIHISSFGGVSYSFNVAYGVGKAGVDRMAKDMQVLIHFLSYTIPHYTPTMYTLYLTMPHYFTLYHTIPHHITSYHTIPHYTTIHTN
jgi:NAD(P)-dependent dehydrogenase (short-subunit alcohol dehydrogenase family)